MGQRNIICLLSLITSVLYVEGQAPEDFDPTCRSGINIDRRSWFSAQWKLLLDTYDYKNLYNLDNRNPVWKFRDLDDDGLAWLGLGGSCSNTIYVCESNTPQNNWLFSQFISYKSANEVFFNISYDFSLCQDPECNKDYLTLYRYDQNALASDSTVVSNYLNSPLLGTESSSRIQQSGVPTTVTTTLSLDRPRNFSGFHLGIRDEGTCGSISRIIIYYLVCPERVEGLVRYGETAVPLKNSPDITFQVACAPNSYNVTSLEVIVTSATSICMDRAPDGARCECNPGYFLLNPTTCQGKSFKASQD